MFVNTAAVRQSAICPAAAVSEMAANLEQWSPSNAASELTVEPGYPPRGGAIGGLTRSLAELLQRPVAIVTLNGQLLAAHGPGTGADDHRLAQSFWRAAHREMHWRQNQSASKSMRKTLRIATGEAERGSATQIVCPVCVDDSSVAYVFIWEGQAHLSPICVMHAEHTALAAGLYFEQRQKCLALETSVGTMLLTELLNGSFQEEPVHTALCASINLHLQHEYRVAALIIPERQATEGSKPADTRLDIELLSTLLAETAAPRAVCQTVRGAIFLLPGQSDITRFWHAVNRPSASLIVGAPVKGVQAIASSHTDVQSLCATAEPGAVLYTHGKLLLPSVLKGDSDAQEAFVESIFGRLSKMRGGRALVKSLATFARFGFHQARAAKALYVHPNTLRYRIDRISQTLGLDLLDAEVRFRVQLASHLWALEVERGSRPECNPRVRGRP